MLATSRKLRAAAFAWAVLASAAGPASADEKGDTGQYWALLSDGQEVTGSRVDNWQDRNAGPRLSGRHLLDTRNPVRVLIHTARMTIDPARGPAVFLANGDVLVGRVTGFRPAEPGANLPDRFLVITTPRLMQRGERRSSRPTRTEVQVRADAVERIAFGQQAPRPYRGGAIFLADGGGRTVSSVRLTADEVRGLSEDSIVTARLDELSELHMPKVDHTAAVLADGTALGDVPAPLIARMQTTGGSALTYLPAMREWRSDAHLVQPSWALSPIGVREDTVAVRSYRRPTELPLSLLDAETLAEKSFTGFVWPWRRNRNVRGGPLQCGTYVCGLGVGTHSHSEVAFTLPPGAKSFTCLVGLDRAVGDGGCARCAICADSAAGRRIWQSGAMVGSAKPVRVGPVSVAGAKRLVLVTEYAHEGRPAGADPGDVRDEVNWMMPLVTVSASALALKAEDLPRLVPALAGWSVAPKDLAGLNVRLAYVRGRTWQVAMDVPPKGLDLTRKMRISLHHALLDISAARGLPNCSHVVEVLVDGKVLPSVDKNDEALKTNRRGEGSAVEQSWQLGPYLGKDVTITVRTTGADSGSQGRALIWHGLGFRPLVANLPGDGKIARPDVPLRALTPTSVIWHPQDKGKRPTATSLPKCEPRKLFGVTLPDAYAISAGMRITYKLKPAFRRFVAVVGTENPYHRGPFLVLMDGKEAWRSSEAVDRTQLEQAVVVIPPGTRTMELAVEHNMTSGVWAQAGFLTR